MIILASTYKRSTKFCDGWTNVVRSYCSKAATEAYCTVLAGTAGPIVRKLA